MPDEVETMFYVGRTPWHGKGVEVAEEDTFDIKKCLQASGLDWPVNIYPCYARVEYGGYLEIPSFATVRELDNTLLGVVGTRYTPLQNIDAFSIFQPFLDTEMVRLHTAGSLFNGKRVWILAKIGLNPIEIVKHDYIERYILLSHSHDGSLKINFGFTPIRVVCANTLAMALSDKLSKILRIKHTKNAMATLEVARETINIFNNEFETTAAQYKYLASRQINKNDLEKYIKTVFEVKEEPLSTRMSNIVNKVMEYSFTSPGNNLSAVSGTRWAAYNAVTYYLNYDYGRTDDSRLDALWFGKSANVSNRALAIALKD